MKIFLDVGAHIGQTLKIALEDKYGFDKIYCFEPVSECCDVLRTFKDDRIVICEYGLWDENCAKRIYSPKSKGASVFKEKCADGVESREIKLISTGEWFSQNLKADDRVYLKLNCEGSECAILDDLINTGEIGKIDVLTVDFDVRKIPSQKHLMNEMKAKLSKLGIPKIFYIDEYHLGRGTHSYFTHYWLDNS
jgi:FkbM family methyltransferase